MSIFRSKSKINIDCRLENNGIGAVDIKKLENAGHKTVKSILMQPMKELLKIRGMSENKILKILKAGKGWRLSKPISSFL